MLKNLRNMAVVGTGLMGASLGLAAKRAFAQLRIWGADDKPQALEEALRIGAIDEAVPMGKVVEADLLCLAMPMRYLPKILEQLGPALNQGVLWMDVGSSKQNVLAQVKAFFGHVPARFVPCHPMAGNERTGALAARADLFAGSKLLLVPHEGLAAQARAEVTAFWQALGSQVLEMEAKEHDEVLAFTSHLPHLLAFALANALEGESQRLCAGMGPGFFSFMRLAKSEPSLWEDICMANKEALLGAMERYQSELCRLRAALEEEPKGQALLKLLGQAHQRRQAW
ncbi:MAG: prephenate dehydrogenase/arogenate dehydrogenase family protein [Cystobacterineae bacterium]|nr:prephenate dehydrogenase/arogenate dehydrogenase family protein [Cystobacterineae bacterium]